MLLLVTKFRMRFVSIVVSRIDFKLIIQFDQFTEEAVVEFF